MVLLDTNAILRYLLNDNPDQKNRVTELINAGSFTTPEVIAEVVYVLLRIYKTTREEISWAIHCLILDVKIDNIKAMRYALGVFNQTSLDFVDCLLIAYNKVFGIEVLSFDKKLNHTMNRDLGIYQINIDDFSIENEI